MGIGKRQRFGFIPIGGVDSKRIDESENPRCHIDEHFEEAENLKFLALVAEHGHPTPQKDDFDVEENEEDRDEIELDRDSLFGRSGGSDPAFIGRVLVGRCLFGAEKPTRSDHQGGNSGSDEDADDNAEVLALHGFDVTFRIMG